MCTLRELDYRLKVRSFPRSKDLIRSQAILLSLPRDESLFRLSKPFFPVAQMALASIESNRIKGSEVRMEEASRTNILPIHLPRFSLSIPLAYPFHSNPPPSHCLPLKHSTTLVHCRLCQINFLVLHFVLLSISITMKVSSLPLSPLSFASYSTSSPQQTPFFLKMFDRNSKRFRFSEAKLLSTPVPDSEIDECSSTSFVRNSTGTMTVMFETAQQSISENLWNQCKHLSQVSLTNNSAKS